MADLFLPRSQIYSYNVLTVKRFGDKYKLSWSRAVRRKGLEACSGKTSEYLEPMFPMDTESQEKLSNNISRARSTVFEYAYCNPWDYFVTLTISPERFNRYQLNDYVKVLGKFINNYHTNHHSKISYLLIPERHKDGAWHMHGLMSGILPKHLIINSNGYLDFPMYSRKFGYCSLSPVKSHDRVSKYITKYISKDFLQMPYGQRLYYCSKGLKKSELLYQFENVDSSCIEWDFVHPDGYCKTALLDNLDVLQSLTLC